MATVSIERLHVDLQYTLVQTGNVLIWSVESAPIATYKTDRPPGKSTRRSPSSQLVDKVYTEVSKNGLALPALSHVIGKIKCFSFVFG